MLSKLAEQQTDEHPYTEWIKTYSSKEFNALVNEIETLLDALAKDTLDVRRAYRKAMQCEFNFFSAPLEEH